MTARQRHFAGGLSNKRAESYYSFLRTIRVTAEFDKLYDTDSLLAKTWLMYVDDVKKDEFCLRAFNPS